MGLFDKISEALGGGDDFGEEAYNGHSNPTPQTASSARRQNRAKSAKMGSTFEQLSDEEASQLITGKHFWEFFSLEFERNEEFQKFVVAKAIETGAVDAYNPDPLKGMDKFWVTSNGTPYQTKKEAVAAEKKSIALIHEEIWHIDEEGNPTTMATIEEQEIYLEAEMAAEEERLRAELEAEAAAADDEAEDTDDDKSAKPDKGKNGTK